MCSLLNILQLYRSYMMKCQKFPLFGGVNVYLHIVFIRMCILSSYGVPLWFSRHFSQNSLFVLSSTIRFRLGIISILWMRKWKLRAQFSQPSGFLSTRGDFYSRGGYLAIAKNIFGYHSWENATGQPLTTKNFLVQMLILLNLRNAGLNQDILQPVSGGAKV